MDIDVDAAFEGGRAGGSRSTGDGPGGVAGGGPGGVAGGGPGGVAEGGPGGGERDTTALPVAVRAAGPHRDAIRSWIEGVLGWQPVELVGDPLVPPAIEVRDLASDAVRSGVPCVLLVDDGASLERVGEVASRTAPELVLGWPSGRDRLRDAAAPLLSRPPGDGRPSRVLRVGGSAGGVGTTTVALALAGIAAWAGRRSFVAVRGTGLAPRALPAAALAAPDVWARADPVVGTSGLRAVTVADPAPIPQLTDPSVEVCVLDHGVDADVDVLVCRPDAAALAVLTTTTAAAIVLVGDGPARRKELAVAASGRRGVRLPWSARVARAGHQGRVPAGLPGAWLARLEPLAPVVHSGGDAGGGGWAGAT